MPRLALVFLGLTLAMSPQWVVAAEDEPSSPSQVIRRALSFLEADMRDWRSNHGCAACHHGPMFVWTMHAARQRGFKTNRALVEETTRWMLDDPKSRVFPKREPDATVSNAAPEKSAICEKDSRAASEPSANTRPAAAPPIPSPKKMPIALSQPTLYLAHALAASPVDDTLRERGLAQIRAHWEAARGDDGAWSGRVGWPPIFNTRQILTRYATTAIADEKANAWLQDQTVDTTTQGLALRLLATPTGPATERVATKQKRVDEVLALQRDDGGWSQTSDRPADAFATGQLLYALRRAGLAADHPQVRRGVAFLVRTQNTDGTWTMTSRPNPATGKPADYLNPITYWGTAWATLGLLEAAP